jgi:Ubiquitin elongating factor core
VRCYPSAYDACHGAALRGSLLCACFIKHRLPVHRFDVHLAELSLSVAMALQADVVWRMHRRQVLMDFLKALLNDLSYLLDDALDRVADVAAINRMKADAARWDALTQEERRTNESFRASQASSFPRLSPMPCTRAHTTSPLRMTARVLVSAQKARHRPGKRSAGCKRAARCVQISTGSGFMSMAASTLRMLLDLVKHAPIAQLFLTGSLPMHSAHIVLHLLGQMLGEREDGMLAVTDVRWKPDVIICDLLALATALARDDAYVQVRAPAADCR